MYTWSVATSVGYVDVTRSLETWLESSDPNQANAGWVMIPAGPDGWDFYASDGAEPPTLIVT